MSSSANMNVNVLPSILLAWLTAATKIKLKNDAELFGKQQLFANWKVCQESSSRVEPLASIYHPSQLIVSVASVRVCYLATLASVLDALLLML